MLNSSLYLENVMLTKNNRQDQNQGTKNKNQISRMWLLWLNHGTVELKQMDVNIFVHSVLIFHGRFQTWSWQVLSGRLYCHLTQVFSRFPMFTANHGPVIHHHVGVSTDACSYLFFFLFVSSLQSSSLLVEQQIAKWCHCIIAFHFENILFCKMYSFVFSHNVLLHVMQHFHLIFLRAATLTAAC